MWKAIIVAVIGIVILGLGVLLSDPYFFTPAQTLYEIGLQKTDYASDNINSDEQKEGAYYFEKALAKGYRERKVYAMLLSTYSHIASDSTREQMLNGALADYPQDAEFFFWRADSRMGQHKFRLAIHDYNQVITNKKAHIGYQEGALYFRGAAWYLLGDTAKAASDFALVQRQSGRQWRDYSTFASDYSQMLQ